MVNNTSQNYSFWKGKKIVSLKENQIFVYGANPEFRNGAGAAKFAVKFGAKPYGGGRGIVGQTFGLITKNLTPGFTEKATGITYSRYGKRSVSKTQISQNINELYECAIKNPDKDFLIAYMNDNSNLNGYSSKEMWELFIKDKKVPNNIYFHESFKIFLKNNINTELSYQSKKPEQPISEQPINKSPQNIKDTLNDNKYTFFFGSASPFSQWHPAFFKVKDKTFISAEQFMMYCKAKLFKDEEMAEKIMSYNAKVAHMILNIGRLDVNQQYRKTILENKELLNQWNGLQKEIKKCGRKVKNFDETLWDTKKLNYIKKGNFEKFFQNNELKDKLLNTKGTLLVEASPYDRVWGIGLSLSDPRRFDKNQWRGENLLGLAITQVRDKIVLDISEFGYSTKKNTSLFGYRKI